MKYNEHFLADSYQNVDLLLEGESRYEKRLMDCTLAWPRVCIMHSKFSILF